MSFIQSTSQRKSVPIVSTILIMIGFLLASSWSFAQTESKVARIKYRGGGDWYNDPSSLSNLIAFTSDKVTMNVSTSYDDVALGSRNLHEYSFAFLTGHGTITVNRAEADNLRKFLENGGFLYIDDDYGLDSHVRNMLKLAFPEENLIELPLNHAIYHQVYDFDTGLPKVHEHDNKPARGYGLFVKGRMVVFYTYESNLSDGWANPEVHNNPPSLRLKALEMGANILVYALTN